MRQMGRHPLSGTIKAPDKRVDGWDQSVLELQPVGELLEVHPTTLAEDWNTF